MAWSVIWQDIARVGVYIFTSQQASENIAQECNILPYYTTNHLMMFLFYRKDNLLALLHYREASAKGKKRLSLPRGPFSRVCSQLLSSTQFSLFTVASKIAQ